MLASAPDKAAAKRRLSRLQARYPWPPGCSLAQIFLGRVLVGKLPLFMVGCIARLPGGASVVGAAADSGGYPVDRAFFETIERVSLMLGRASRRSFPVRDAAGEQQGQYPARRVFPREARPTQLRAALSNGVALHSSWNDACKAALRELVERDRVLRSFRGEFAPRRLRKHVFSFARKLQPYSPEAYLFGPARTKLRHQVAGVFLFPRDPVHPLAYGFGAGENVEQAVAAASGEALQRLAFLWGETLPDAPPTAAATPDFHQEHYLYPPHHAQLRRWLAGDWPLQRTAASAPFDGNDTQFIDLTPPALRGTLWIAKASSPRALLLQFGVRTRRSIPHPIP